MALKSSPKTKTPLAKKTIVSRITLLNTDCLYL